MTNYNNGKIYKIEPICDHDENEIYIGSTTKDMLCQRMATHRMHYKQWKEGKRNKTMSHDLFDKYGIENCSIILIENVDANSKDELLAREKHYIKTLKCINKYIPKQTDREYYEKNKECILQKCKQYKQDNKEKIKENAKIYSQNNKEKISEKNKQYAKDNKEKLKGYRSKTINCECGRTYTLGHKLRHFKSQKHQNYLEEQDI
jgi:ribosome-interacting GTPase 1